MEDWTATSEKMITLFFAVTMAMQLHTLVFGLYNPHEIQLVSSFYKP